VGGLVGYKLYTAILETYILEVLFYQLIHETLVKFYEIAGSSSIVYLSNPWLRNGEYKR